MEFCAFFDSTDHKLYDTSVIKMYLATFDLLLKANLKKAMSLERGNFYSDCVQFLICWLKYVCILLVCKLDIERWDYKGCIYV